MMNRTKNGTKYVEYARISALDVIAGFVIVLIGFCLAYGMIASAGKTARGDGGVQSKSIRAFTREVNQPAAVEVTEMGQNVWISQDGDGSVVGSWSLGTLPSTSDFAIFDGSSTHDWNTGLSMQHAQLLVKQSNQVQIGFDGEGLTIGTGSGQKHVLRGDGDIYLGGVAGTATKVIVDMGIGRVILGASPAGSTVIPFVYCKGGLIEVRDVAGMITSNDGTAFWVTGPRAQATIEQGDGTHLGYETTIVSDGFLHNKRDQEDSGDLITQSGGEIFQTGLIKGVVVIHGGTLVYEPLADPTGLSPTFYVNGVLDIRGSRFDIPVGAVIRGPNGIILGSAVDTAGGIISIDLSEELP